MKKFILVACLCTVAFATKVPNAPTKYPSGMLGEYVKLGEDIMRHTSTHPLSKDLVGNSLSCSSCHLEEGRKKTLGTLIGTAAAFPAYSKREGNIQSLEDRINNCFMRSMNGKRPINGTKLSMALSTYITWLSSGIPMKMNPKKPINSYFSAQWPSKKAAKLAKAATHANYLAGEKLYAAKCAACHGDKGQGMGEGMPPVWGEKSFNTGAGLSKPVKLATWLKYNMPLGEEGSLKVEDAVNLAIFIDAQPRPDFSLQKHLHRGVFYNSLKMKEKSNVEANFKALGLDLAKIKGGAK